MSPAAKIQFSFLVLGLMYFAGGIEYAVSLPKGLLYWHYHTHLSAVVLSVFLLGYSIAAFCAAPLMGRLLDRRGGSKQLLLTGTFLHLMGAVADFVGRMPWLQVVARFVSGFGGGIDAVVLAEAVRYMSHSKKTRLLAIFIGIRQLALILMPGVNYFLGGLDPKLIQKSDVTANTPALMLIVLWALVCLCALLLYTDLSRLMYASFSAPHSRPNTPVFGHRYTPVRHSSQGESHPVPVPSSSRRYSHRPSTSGLYQSLGRASEMIEEAEKLIKEVTAAAYGSFNTADAMDINIVSEEGRDTNSSHGQNYSQRDSLDQMSTSFNHVSSHESVMTAEAQTIVPDNLTVSLTLSSGNFDHDSYVLKYSALPHSLHMRSFLRMLFEEFIREDVLAVLVVLFAGFFAQVAFQVLILPLTEELLPGEELYSIVIYSLAFVQLLVVLVGVWCCGGRIGDHHLAMAGTCVLVVSNLWLLAVRPHVTTPTNTFDWNLTKVCVSVCLCVLGAPLLLVLATSMLTKLSKPLHQGVSQGVYHSCLALAGILAALWTEGTHDDPYLQHGVIIGLLSLALLLMAVCYKRFTQHHSQPFRRKQSQISRIERTEITAPPPPSRQQSQQEHVSIESTEEDKQLLAEYSVIDGEDVDDVSTEDEDQTERKSLLT